MVRRAASITRAAGAAVVLVATLSPAVASAAEGDSWVNGVRYTEVVFDHDVKPSPFFSERWWGECPSEFPWLDRFEHTPGIPTAQGFRVTRTSDWLDVNDSFGVFRVKRPLPVEGVAWSGSGGTVSNWAFQKEHLKIEMVCTSDPDRAWIA